uniref:Uncharacterized protein n=1 Tax=Pipistrellus kuhlii TaxID=59472 RepID=A0A7J7ZJD6_PIPKU|nr:hypothetical protein mPipKuh1_009494 [Pipistrellus kuhlii]
MALGHCLSITRGQQSHLVPAFPISVSIFFFHFSLSPAAPTQKLYSSLATLDVEKRKIFTPPITPAIAVASGLPLQKATGRLGRVHPHHSTAAATASLCGGLPLAVAAVAMAACLQPSQPLQLCLEGHPDGCLV